VQQQHPDTTRTGTIASIVYLIIWTFNGIEIVRLSLTLDAREAFLVIKSFLGIHFLSLKNLKKIKHILLIFILTVKIFFVHIFSSSS